MTEPASQLCETGVMCVLLTTVKEWDPQQTDSETEKCTQELSWGESLGSSPVRQRGEQDWADGEVELQCSSREGLSASGGNSEPGMALQSCLKLRQDPPTDLSWLKAASEGVKAWARHFSSAEDTPVEGHG